MQRVLIVGAAGSGKTFLASRLGAITELPVINLDSRHWLPGWVPKEQVAWREEAAEMAKGGRWIMDGNYFSTMPSRLEYADTLIALDLPRRVYFFRLLIRMITRWGRPKQADNSSLVERFSIQLLKRTWGFAKRPSGIFLAPQKSLREHMLTAVQEAEAKGIQVFHLSTTTQVSDFIASINRAHVDH